MLPTSSDNPNNYPERDEAYWQSLLEQVDALAPSEIGTPGNETKDSVNGDAALTNSDQAWSAVQQAFEDERVIDLQASGYNKGGLLVEYQGIAGFVPASQLEEFANVHLESERMRELQRRQHDKLRLKIIEVDRAQNRLIFSERAAQIDADERRSLWDEVKPGDVRSGTITNLASFGAFVDLGGVEGLIHISELSWSRLNHPSDVVQPGQSIETKVLEVDRAAGRVALSLKQMRPDPWIGIEKRYQEGQLVEGTINSVVPFGAFVTLEPQLEGLIHVSELAEGNFLHPRNVVQKGDKVRARVLTVDGAARRLALSMRGVDQSNL